MKRFASLLALCAVFALAGSAWAEPPAVSQVVAIDTKGDTDKLLSHAKSNEKIFERLGIDARRRYLQASIAGPESGTVVVVIEYPSLAAMAAAQEKLQNDAEWDAYVDDVTNAGMIIESNSVWVELTP